MPIGGTAAGAGNVISGNSGAGILLQSDPSNNVPAHNLIQGNLIGVDLNSTANLGNTGAGIAIQSGSTNLIGGPTAGAGNTIAMNQGGGILLSAGMADAFLENLIYSDGASALALASGTNNSIQAPVLSTPVRSSAGVTANIALSGTANTSDRVELFASSGGSGPARVLLGVVTLTTDNTGKASLRAGPFNAPAGQTITATATDPANDTSAFAGAITV